MFTTGERDKSKRSTRDCAETVLVRKTFLQAFVLPEIYKYIGKCTRLKYGDAYGADMFFVRRVTYDIRDGRTEARECAREQYCERKGDVTFSKLFLY